MQDCALRFFFLLIGEIESAGVAKGENKAIALGRLPVIKPKSTLKGDPKLDSR